jgi:hypothetical protein
MTWHPAWELAIQILVALGTLSLAVVTLALVLKTRGMVEVAQSQLELGIRPLLVDPSPRLEDEPPERLLFGAPGRISPSVPAGELFWQENGTGGVSHFSVAFENLGSGIAAVRAWRTNPLIPGNVYVSRNFVPVGTLLRVNISVLPGPMAERFKDHWWAIDGIDVEVDYTSMSDGEILTSVASIKQYATQGPFVQEVKVFRQSDGRVIAEGRGSY